MIEKIGYNFYNLNMSRTSEIIQELNNLPKGYISEKTIHGKVYYYLQYLENGKITSHYIGSDSVDNTRFLLQKRKNLEEELNLILNSGNNLHKPGKNSDSFTGSLMMEDTKVATFENGNLIYINESLCPLYIKRTHNLSGFLKSRAIDQTRTNARLLKKVLGIKDNEEEKIVLYAYGASITDNYWFKPKCSKLKYSDISFDIDFYSDLALKGELIVFPKTPKLTPQLTTPGSYEKCWKKPGDTWWLYKKGNKEEIFSELFCSKLAKKLKIPTAVYEYDDGFIRSKNFADKYNFEPMSSLASDDDSFDHVFSVLLPLGKKFTKRYITLCWFDCLVNNVDRHNENCGLMRDKKTGKIVDLAPNFDNNLALISRSPVLNLDPRKDGLISMFATFLRKNKEAAEIYKELVFPELNNKIIEDCFNDIPIDENKELITKFLLNRYNYLLSLQ